MQAIKTLRMFGEMAKAYSEPYFFVTTENPTHVKVKEIAQRPKSWEAFPYQNEDSEDTLGLSRGTYLVCADFEADMSMFYRVSGSEGAKSDNTALKQALTMIDRLDAKVLLLEKKLEEKDAIILELGRRLEKKTRKLDKAKARMKDHGGEIAKDLVQIVAEKASEVISVVTGNHVQSPPVAPRVTVTEVVEDDDLR